MDAHNFPSDWEYYEWLEGRKEPWDESYDEDEEDGGEDEQEVDGVGDDG